MEDVDGSGPAHSGLLGQARLEASGQGASINQFGVVGRDVTVYNLAPVQPREAGPPHQTPSCDPCFYGRAEPLGRIDDVALNQALDTVRIVVLAGLPGIGRRTTARQWAHRTARASMFPGGELNIDFEEYRDRAGGDIAAAVGDALSAFGVDQQWPGASPSALAARYRSVTFSREPVLVVLEHVTEPAQVYALAPNRPGSVVVVAADKELGELVTLHGAELIRLEPLDAAAGADLLACAAGADRVAAEPEAASRLVELCGGLPLAIRLAAGRMRLEPHLSVADYVHELDDEAGRLEGLAPDETPVLSLQLDQTLRRLPASAAALYGVLGLLPVRTFTAQVAAVAAQLPQKAASAALRTLRASSLVSQYGEGRYRLHDLVRLHARTTGDHTMDAERERVILRQVVGYLLPLAGFADRAIMGRRTRTFDLDGLLAGRPDPFADRSASDAAPERRLLALRWFEDERANLMAVLRAAAREGTLDSEASVLAEMLTALFLNRRYLADWIESGTLGAEAAARIGAVETEARLRSLISRPLSDLGELDRAGRELDRAVRLVERAGNAVLHASVLEFQGRYLNHVDPPAAASVYARALDLNLGIGELRGAALVVFFAGENLENAGQPQQALDTLLEARRRFDQLEPADPRNAARVGLALGRVLATLGRTEEARGELTRAAESLARVGAAYYEARACELRGDLEAQHGDRAAAAKSLARALEVYESAGDPRADIVRDQLTAMNAQAEGSE